MEKKSLSVEDDEQEDWSGCVCDKWEISYKESGSKAGKSKGSKSKGSKSEEPKVGVYHKKCIKWLYDEDIE